MKKIDFHIHTLSTASDARFTFDQNKLQEYIINARLDAIAVTNHNIFDIEQYKLIRDSIGIPVFPGIEIDLDNGHLLLIADICELNDFNSRCSKITNQNIGPMNPIAFSELIKIYHDLSKYILIPHYYKDPVVNDRVLQELRNYISAGEVSNPKKFMYCKKNENSLVPVYFSDCRICSEFVGNSVRQTYINCGEITLGAIKGCLRDKNKVSLSLREGHSLFQVFNNGQELSTGLNVIVGERSTGKSYTLDLINKEYWRVCKMLTKQQEEYLECLIVQAKKKCKEQYGVNIEKNIKIDMSKSLEENKNLVLQTIKDEKDLKLKEKKDNPKEIISNTSRDYSNKHREIEKANMFEKKKKEIEMMNKIMAEINSNIKCDNVDIKNHYERLRKAVELTAKGYMNCCFIQGQGGLGKSFQTTAILNELGLKYGKDYVEFSGDITLAYIYRFIHENNGKIIIFRDLVRLLNELKGIDLFKAMTETHGTRRISKATYSKEQKDLPPSYEVKSNFIFEFNSIKLNGFKEDLMALFSRGDYVNLVLSVEQIKDIMLKICKNDEEKEITNYLFDNHKFYGYNNLNLRTQQKAFKICKYAKEHDKNWKDELMIFLKSEMSNIKKMLYSYMGNKVFRTSDLKSLLVRTGIDNCYHLRTADRRIREWIMLRELFIVGYISNDDEELEKYIDTNRNYLVSLNPIEKLELIKIQEEKKPILNLA